MPGMDRRTGRMLDDMDHIAQSIETIMTTRIGERVMREWFGTPPNAILGQAMTQPEIMRWWTIIYAAITMFEPRFIPRGLTIEKAERTGKLQMVMQGEYRPFAHLNFRQSAVFIAVSASGVVVRKAG